MVAQHVAVYLDAKVDDSYTPLRLVVRAGSGFHDLEDVGTLNAADPTGWCILPIADPRKRYGSARVCLGKYSGNMLASLCFFFAQIPAALECACVRAWWGNTACRC
jgi:hypothetical protein